MGTELPPDQAGAQHTRLDLKQSHKSSILKHCLPPHQSLKALRATFASLNVVFLGSFIAIAGVASDELDFHVLLSAVSWRRSAILTMEVNG